VRDFAENRGGFGNAFIINFPYWWDHRAIGMEAGRNDFPNGVPALDQLIPYMQTSVTRADQYRLDPNRDLAFFYSPLDQATQEWLQRAFPQGSWLENTTYQPEDTYRLFTVPALGEAGLTEFFAQMTAPQS
jgi:predicted ATPase